MVVAAPNDHTTEGVAVTDPRANHESNDQMDQMKSAFLLADGVNHGASYLAEKKADFILILPILQRPFETPFAC